MPDAGGLHGVPGEGGGAPGTDEQGPPTALVSRSTHCKSREHVCGAGQGASAEHLVLLMSPPTTVWGTHSPESVAVGEDGASPGEKTMNLLGVA